MIKKGTKVINPDISNSKSDNYVGTVKESYSIRVEGEIIRFALVQFRDYESRLAKRILKRI